MSLSQATNMNNAGFERLNIKIKSCVFQRCRMLIDFIYKLMALFFRVH